MNARLRLLGLVGLLCMTVVMIAGTASLGQDVANKKLVDKAKVVQQEISIQSETLQSMKQSYNEAVTAVSALTEAKRIGANKDDCAMKLMELNAAAKQNAWQAIEVSARYLSSVPVKGWTLDFQKGVYRPEDVTLTTIGKP